MRMQSEETWQCIRHLFANGNNFCWSQNSISRISIILLMLAGRVVPSLNCPPSDLA
jgi:hypothetical protein